MSGNKADSDPNNASSIYAKFKQNTQKIFNDESFKDGLDKGYQMLEGRQPSKHSSGRDSNK